MLGFTFTEPEISPKNYLEHRTPEQLLKEDWFVHVRYLDDLTGKWISRKFRAGITSATKHKQRVKYIQIYRDQIKNRLVDGWNPLTKLTSNAVSFTAALDFGLSKCDVSIRTYGNYRCSVAIIKQGAMAINLGNTPIDKIERKHIKAILEYCAKNNAIISKAKKAWSNHAYNKNLGYLSAVLSQCEEWELIKYNPAHKISYKNVVETRKYLPYTEIERNRIRMYLTWPGHPLPYSRFFTFIMLIYSTGIRPKEVLALRISSCDLETRVITILPNLINRTSKTNSIRYVPINDFLLVLLKEQIGNAAGNLFLFGSPCIPTKGNGGTGNGVRNINYFVPSLVQIKRDTVTRLWNKLVMVDLKIHKHLYASKHSGADAKILAGIPIEALQELYGHTSKLMTKKYVSVLQEIYHKQIIEKSSDF